MQQPAVQKTRGYRQHLGEGHLKLGVRCALKGDGVKGVVGGAAAHGFKAVDPGAQRFFERRVGADLFAAHGLQLFQPREKRGRGDAQRLVGAEGRAHLHLKGLVRGDQRVVFQRIGGVVCGANALYVRFLDQLPRGKAARGDFGVRFVPDRVQWYSGLPMNFGMHSAHFLNFS